MGNAYTGVSTTYTPIEYIQSNGGQWIDTGFVPDSNTKIEIQVKFTTNYQQILWSSRDWEGVSAVRAYNTFFFLTNRTQARCDYDTNGTAFNYAPSVDTLLTYIQDKNVLKEGSTTLYTATAATFSMTDSMILFAGNYFDGVYNFASVKMYYCKIWDNDTLVRDFIPVIGSDGIPCLWDKIQGKAYYNEGYDGFSAGSVVAGDTYTVSNVARKVKKIYVGANDVAKKVKKAYIGINDTARLVYDSSYIYDLFGNASKSDNNYSYFCVTHTTDYLIVSGGQQFNNTTPSTVTRAINENGVWTTCTNLPTRASYQGPMSINGYGIIASGKTASSGSSRTNQCIAYSNNLTRSTLSTVNVAVFESATASSDTHCVLCGGSNYSTTLPKQAQAYNTSLVKTTLTDTSVFRRDQCGASLGKYAIFCGGYCGQATSSVTDFYDNNNVKTTGAYPYSSNKYIWYNKGISNGTYAMFFGGRSTDNTTGTYYDDIIVYDTNLVSTVAHLPYGICALQGFALGDAIFVGSGSVDMQGAKGSSAKAYIYNNTLTVQKTLNIPVIGNVSTYNADANKKFGGFFGNGSNHVGLIKQ